MEHVTEECTCSGKRCPRCETVKCRGMFYQSKNYTTGVTFTGSYCRKCGSERRVEWQRENPERNKVGKRDWMNNHRERGNVAHEKWRLAHPEKARDALTVQRAKRRARERFAEGFYTVQEWEDLKAKYKNACLRCGKQEPDIALTPDHVIPLARGGTNYIHNIQPLCKPCNSKKYAKVIDFRPESA